MIYSSRRGIYVSFINKAQKDNSIVKKGEPYIRVKKDKFSKFELFKNIDELDKRYPRMLSVSEPELRRILNDFLISDKNSKDFLHKYFEV